MKRFITIVSIIFSGRLRNVLIFSFMLMTAFTVGLGALVVSRLINDYLADATSQRVARDMNLAKTFYQLKVQEVTSVSQRIARDPLIVQNLTNAIKGREAAIASIDEVISRKITVPTLGGTHFVAVFDADGNILVGRVLSVAGSLSPLITDGNWGQLPIVADGLSSGHDQAATEVIPIEFLDQVGLGKQAQLPLIDTPKAAPALFDPREGTAGLALTSVAPILGTRNEVIGAVLVAHIFNNDFSLVNRIKEAAEIDTVTIFFGDLRVSTNVLTESGERAVGTRMSQEVYNVVLRKDQDYVGRAFVVNEWFITHYVPLHDHLGHVVGSLYVGARESAYQALAYNFNERVVVIALICIALAGVIAFPVARLITLPLSELMEANRHLANGEMTVRVQPYGHGELAMLGESFNKMAETLNRAQKELLHKERLASMGQLAAGVAHEINNPLGTILLFSDMMYKETPEGDPRRDDLKMIINEATRCKRIVADLLNFTRQQEVLAQDTDVNALLGQAVGKVHNQPNFEKVEIFYQFSSDLPVIQADPAQLEQVFINLLNNAAEAMENGGTVTLTTRQVDNQWVEIQVTDTGRGISEENLGKLFTPFFTTKQFGKGTGLGLSIIYGIIKMHQGQIHVQSKVDQGTTFTVTLPIRLPKE